MYYRDLNGMSKAGMRHGRVVGCDFVTTWSREIDGDHFLEVEAGTNGYQEEEGENGCGVYLSVRDLDGKGIHVLTGREDCKRVETDELLFHKMIRLDKKNPHLIVFKKTWESFCFPN